MLIDAVMGCGIAEVKAQRSLVQHTQLLFNKCQLFYEEGDGASGTGTEL